MLTNTWRFITAAPAPPEFFTHEKELQNLIACLGEWGRRGITREGCVHNPSIVSGFFFFLKNLTKVIFMIHIAKLSAKFKGVHLI